MKIGVSFHREQDPSTVADQARAAEEAGYGSFWLIEDCFYTSSPALASAALTATETIDVGIGILPSVARNAAITAMELATLARLAPGRFHAGIGHGVQEWMGQIGARPASPLTAFEEVVGSVRRLLHGEEVTLEGRYVTMDRVRLHVAPDPPPPIWAGVRGPRSLELAGEITDGTILVELTGPAGVAAARAALGRTDHMIMTFAAMSIGPDPKAARTPLIPLVADKLASGDPGLSALPFYDELTNAAKTTSWSDVVAGMPHEYWTQIGPIGTPEDAATFLNAMSAAGVHSVSIFPNPADPIGDLETFADAVFPLLENP